MNNTHISQALVQEVHWALQHLYDPAELRKSPLVGRLALADRRNPPAALEERLRAAIQDLRPAENVPVDSNAWRIHQILQRRFVERTIQKQVADELGYSIRQMRRQEAMALQALADHLWHRYALSQSPATGVATLLSSPPAASFTPQTSGSEEELRQIRESFPAETADIGSLIASVLRSTAPLAQADGTRISLQMPEDRPPITGQLAPMRQALLNLLMAAIQCASGQLVGLQVGAAAEQVTVTVWAECDRSPDAAMQTEIGEEIKMSRQLLELCGGQLAAPSAATPGHRLEMLLSLPAIPQLPVLVIDDNADTLRLLQRYLAGTRYRFVPAADPEQAVSVAARLGPCAILLDVMLPGVDGWELLGRLREHPATGEVPVVVCTILPQERVALTLGAVAFLRKPVSRETLLAALDRHAVTCAPTAR